MSKVSATYQSSVYSGNNVPTKECITWSHDAEGRVCVNIPNCITGEELCLPEELCWTNNAEGNVIIDGLKNCTTGEILEIPGNPVVSVVQNNDGDTIVTLNNGVTNILKPSTAVNNANGSTTTTHPDGTTHTSFNGASTVATNAAAGTITHTGADGVVTVMRICDFTQSCASSLVPGPGPFQYTFNNGFGGTQILDVNEIDMDITSMTVTGSVINFEAENGNVGSFDICAIVAANCNSPMTLNADGSVRYVDNAGNTTNIPAPIPNTDTLTETSAGVQLPINPVTGNQVLPAPTPHTPSTQDSAGNQLPLDPVTGNQVLPTPTPHTPVTQTAAGVVLALDPATGNQVLPVPPADNDTLTQDSDGVALPIDPATGRQVLPAPTVDTDTLTQDSDGNILPIDPATQRQVLPTPTPHTPVTQDAAGNVLALDPATGNQVLPAPTADTNTLTETAGGVALPINGGTGRQVLPIDPDTLTETNAGVALPINPATGRQVLPAQPADVLTEDSAGVALPINGTTGRQVLPAPTVDTDTLTETSAGVALPINAATGRQRLPVDQNTLTEDSDGNPLPISVATGRQVLPAESPHNVLIAGANVGIAEGPAGSFTISAAAPGTPDPITVAAGPSGGTTVSQPTPGNYVVDSQPVIDTQVVAGTGPVTVVEGPNDTFTVNVTPTAGTDVNVVAGTGPVTVTEGPADTFTIDVTPHPAGSTPSTVTAGPSGGVTVTEPTTGNYVVDALPPIDTQVVAGTGDITIVEGPNDTFTISVPDMAVIPDTRVVAGVGPVTVVEGPNDTFTVNVTPIDTQVVAGTGPVTVAEGPNDTFTVNVEDQPQPVVATVAGTDFFGEAYPVGGHLIQWADGRVICIPAKTVVAPSTGTPVDNDRGTQTGSGATPLAFVLSDNDIACDAGGTTSYQLVPGGTVNATVTGFNSTNGAYNVARPAEGAWEVNYRQLCNGSIVGTAKDFGLQDTAATTEVKCGYLQEVELDAALVTTSGPTINGLETMGNIQYFYPGTTTVVATAVFDLSNFTLTDVDAADDHKGGVDSNDESVASAIFLDMTSDPANRAGLRAVGTGRTTTGNNKTVAIFNANITTADSDIQVAGCSNPGMGIKHKILDFDNGSVLSNMVPAPTSNYTEPSNPGANPPVESPPGTWKGSSQNNHVFEFDYATLQAVSYTYDQWAADGMQFSHKVKYRPPVSVTCQAGTQNVISAQAINGPVPSNQYGNITFI